MLLPLASEGTRPEGLLPHQRLVTLPVTPLNVSVQHLPTPGLHTLLGWAGVLSLVTPWDLSRSCGDLGMPTQTKESVPALPWPAWPRIHCWGLSMQL